MGFSETITGRLDRAERQLATRLMQRHWEAVSRHTVSVSANVGRRELRAAAREGRFDVVVLSAAEFGACGGWATLRPCAMAAGLRGEPERCAFICQSGRSLVELAGGTVTIAGRFEGDEPRLWLQHFMESQGLAGPERHFRLQEELRSGTLPVVRAHFGHTDACVVREDDFTRVCLDNATVAERLAPLAWSPALPQTLVCVPAGAPAAPELEEAVATWGESLRGRAFARVIGHPRLIEVQKATIDASLRLQPGAGAATSTPTTLK